MPGKVAYLKLEPRTHNCRIIKLFTSACLYSSWVATGFDLSIKTIFTYWSCALPCTLLEFIMNKTAIYWKINVIVILLGSNPPREDQKLAHLMRTGGMVVKNDFAIFNIKNNVFCIFLVDQNIEHFVLLKYISDLLPQEDISAGQEMGRAVTLVLWWKESICLNMGWLVGC